MNCSIDNYLANIISTMKRAGLNKSQIAERAKTRVSTLRYIWEESWNPRVKTLRKIEAGLRPELDCLSESSKQVNKKKQEN